MRHVLSLSLIAAVAAAAPAQEYKTYREAYGAGAKAANAGNLAAARAPLEAAARLAKTDRERTEANRALLIPYRELPDVEPMQRAAEYVIANSAVAFEPSNTRGALLSFAHKRGKMDALVAGYESRLATNPDDRVALFVLAEAYSRYKEDHARSITVGERLAALDAKTGKPADPAILTLVAAAYVKAEKPREGAERFERAAALDAKTEAWHLKEAAAAWLKAGDKAKALAAAKKSAAAGPEKRSEQLAYFWHRGLGDVFLDAGDPKAAVPHYEQAIAATKIAGYVQDTRAKLEKAKAAGQ